MPLYELAKDPEIGPLGTSQNPRIFQVQVLANAVR